MEMDRENKMCPMCGKPGIMHKINSDGKVYAVICLLCDYGVNKNRVVESMRDKIYWIWWNIKRKGFNFSIWLKTCPKCKCKSCLWGLGKISCKNCTYSEDIQKPKCNCTKCECKFDLPDRCCFCCNMIGCKNNKNVTLGDD